MDEEDTEKHEKWVKANRELYGLLLSCGRGDSKLLHAARAAMPRAVKAVVVVEKDQCTKLGTGSENGTPRDRL